MSLSPKTFEEALAKHKPMRRSRMAAKTSLTARGRSNPKKKKKKLTDGQLKKRVWKEFSIFIRTRYADKDGMVSCVTCDARKHWKEMQAGHFVRGRLNANLFDERGCQIQCYVCNIHYQGNVVHYYRFMSLRYGDRIIDELLAQNSTTKKWAGGELLALLEKYKGLNASNPLLAKEKSPDEHSL